MEELSAREKEAISALMKFCAWRDRCQSEIEEKLQPFNLDHQQTDKVIAFLKQHNFLDDLRFAIAYTRGKFNQNKWGKVKIQLELKRKQIEANTIHTALEEISDDDYDAMAERLILQHTDPQSLSNATQKQKTFKYLMQKGFESDVIKAAMQRLMASFRL